MAMQVLGFAFGLTRHLHDKEIVLVSRSTYISLCTCALNFATC
jgi:hypothetical protein